MADLSSLVIRLSADVASLQSDMGKAVGITQRSADQMAGAINGINSLVKEFAKGLAAAFTVDKIIGVAKAAIDLGDSLNKMSQKVGVSVESLSALRNVGQLADASFEQLGAGMVKLSRNAAEAAEGGKQQAAAFAAIGVAVKDANGQLRPTQAILEDVAKKMAGYEDGASKTALATQLFGKAGAELIPVLNQLGEGGFAKAAAAARDYNQVIGQEQAAQSEAFNDNLTRLSMAASGFANAVVKDLLPGLVAYSHDMAEAAKTNDGYASSASGVSTAIKSIVLALTTVKEFLSASGTITFAFFDAVKTTFTASAEYIGTWAAGVAKEIKAAFTIGGPSVADIKAETEGRLDAIAAGASKSFRGIKDALGGGLTENVSNVRKAYNDLFGTFSNVSGAADTTAGAIHKTVAPLLASADAASNAAKALMELAAAQKAAMDMLDSLRGTTDANAKVQAEFDKGMRALQTTMEAWAIAGGDITTIIAAWQEGEDLLKASLEKKNAALAKSGDVLGNYLDELRQSTALSTMTEREKAIATAIAKVTDEWNKNTAAGIRNKQSLQAVVSGASIAAGAAFDLSKAFEDAQRALDQFNSPTPFENLNKAIEEVGEQLKKATDPEVVKRLGEELDRLDTKKISIQLERGAQAVSAGLTSLQGLAKEGTKAYAEMQVAIDAANIAAAIGAIVNQGMGDPYTAFARIAAMAALMATFVHDVGSAGSAGFHDVAASRQESQGTGTVLGDSKAKSESIAKATEITANATTQLVGLNRGMLTALQSLQHALGAAGVQLARGAGEVPTPTLSGNQTAPIGSPVGNAIIGFLFGGSQKVVDQGIVIAGGALNEMLNNIVVGAYQTIETNGGLFGSNSTKEAVTPVAAEFAKQFQLVIGSIIDTVRAGATALGLLPADIEKAIAAYKVEEIKISLKGLSAEDQQKALEAVFSSIFDGLAGAVVPFIGQFQKVGEGLGETLVRVATEVQVTQEAFKQLGLAVDTTDPEKFAQIADGLVEAAGGIDAFISGMQSFVKNFSDSAHQFMIDSDALNSAFSQVGLKLPSTRDGMWELMQSLDASTESGRAAIATLLRLSDTANAYYDQLDKFKENLGLSGNSEFNKQLKSIQDSAIGLIKALQAAGASTQTLQRVYDASVNKINQLIDQMKASAQSLAFSLGLTNHGSLDQINSEITRLQGLAGDGANSVRDFGGAIQDAAQRASDAINLLIGDLSPLNDRAKLEEARKGLMAGTVTQEQFLEIARRLYASSQQYKNAFAFAQQFPGRGASDSVSVGGGSSAQGLSAAQQQRLADLLEEQKKLTAQNQIQQYRDFTQQVVQISEATGEDFTKVLADMGVTDIDELVKGLGLQNQDQLKAYIENIKKQQDLDGNNTKSIVDVLKQILEALGGTPTDSAPGEGLNEPGGGKPGSTNRDLNTNRTSNAPVVPGEGGGRSGGGGSNRMLTDDDADAIGDAVERAMRRIGSSDYRNNRGVTA